MTVAVTGVSGSKSHGGTVAIVGSGFNTKSTAAPALWDKADTGTIGDNWDLWRPSNAETHGGGYTAAYNMQYRTVNYRSVAGPHSRATHYMVGSGTSQNSNQGTAAMANFLKSSRANNDIFYMRWYARIDPNWQFGTTIAQKNHKIWVWNMGGVGPYESPNDAYIDYDQGVFDSITAPAQHKIGVDVWDTPDQNGNDNWWNTGSNYGSQWVLYECELKVQTGTSGYFKMWQDGAIMVNYAGQTDNGAGTSCSVGIGGYTGTYELAPTNNWRYFADIYIDWVAQRVIVANNATLANATIREVWIPSAWSDTSITATVNLGKFADTGTAYVFVFDATGASNSTGFAITLGEISGSGSFSGGGSLTSNTTVRSPFAVHSSGRYLVKAGAPYLLHGDTPWSIVVQLINSEIDTYLADRASRGFNAIMFNAIEHFYSDQTPVYDNADGDQPFTTMTDFASTPVAAYWNRVDYIVNSARTLGIACIINPAYLGFNGGSEGWMSEVTAESAADLQTYGAFLANRYTQDNVIWCLGGDYNGTTTERDKQWNIVTGIRSVRTTDLITAHNSRANGPAYPSWNGYTGFNLNNAYCNVDDVYSDSATEYARAGPIPFFMIEARYENESGTTAAELRAQTYQALLSGACGQLFGNNPVWSFGAAPAGGGDWTAALNSTGAQDQARVRTLFDAYQWWKLVPKQDTSLVSSSLGTGTTRVSPSLASDGSFALVYVPTSQTVTVVMTNFAPSSVRARLYNPTSGAYTTVGGSPFTNTGSQGIATGGERVIVLDAEPSVTGAASLAGSGTLASRLSARLPVFAAFSAAGAFVSRVVAARRAAATFSASGAAISNASTLSGATGARYKAQYGRRRQ